jgi:hypothetical protein
MAQLDGKTPEQIAAEIIEAAQKSTFVEISGVATQNLEQVLRYKYAKKIYTKGEKWFQANLESFQTEFFETVIEAQYTQRKKLDEKQAEQEKHEYVQLLVSRGINRFKALEMAGLLSAEDVEAQKKIDEAAAAKAKAEAEAAKKK